MEFKNVLPATLKIKGMKQKELAEIAEISPGTISDYINKDVSPSLSSVVKIADALNVSLEYLAGNISYEEELGNARRDQLNRRYEELNEDGQIKALEYVDDLCKVDDYRKDESKKYKAEMQNSDIPRIA